MTFNFLKKEDKDEIFYEMGIKKLSLNEKLLRLRKTIPRSQFNNLKNEMITVSRLDVEKSFKMINDIMYRYLRQFGKPFVIKERMFDSKKYGKDGGLIKHHGVFFDKDCVIYHFTPEGVKYGNNEYNKEIISYYEWKVIKENRDKAFFTLLTHKEIEKFVKRWDELYMYTYGKQAPKVFAYVLEYYLN